MKCAIKLTSKISIISFFMALIPSIWGVSSFDELVRELNREIQIQSPVDYPESIGVDALKAFILLQLGYPKLPDATHKIGLEEAMHGGSVKITSEILSSIVRLGIEEKVAIAGNWNAHIDPGMIRAMAYLPKLQTISMKWKLAVYFFHYSGLKQAFLDLIKNNVSRLNVEKA